MFSIKELYFNQNVVYLRFILLEMPYIYIFHDIHITYNYFAKKIPAKNRQSIRNCEAPECQAFVFVEGGIDAACVDYMR